MERRKIIYGLSFLSFFVAVIRALKSLQDKIRRLELDRAVTADKFKQLTEETRREATHQRRDGGEEDSSSSSTDNDSDLGTPPLVSRPFQSEMDGGRTINLTFIDLFIFKCIFICPFKLCTSIESPLCIHLPFYLSI